ncbi:MAG: 2-phospho-L-lactate transferase, partial [Thermoprotei archaeon]
PGLDKAKATEDVIEELKGADAILIGPSNPINSITPIIKVKGIDELLMKLRKRIPIVAVSPLISGRPVSGPADKFMKALGYEPTSYGVAKIYQGYIDAIVIDERDHFLKDRIEKELKVKVAMCDTLMKDLDSKVRLARVVIELIEAIESEGSHQV